MTAGTIVSGSSRAWLVALVALLPHLGGLANGFVYDDFRFFVENPGVQTLEQPWELVVGVERMSMPPDRDIWRPLRTILFACEHASFGARAALWHAVSLLLHLLLVRGVIALVQRIPGTSAYAALGAGLLFGVHPLTVESVAWISSQGDLLAAMFAVGCLVFAGTRPWLASGAAVLALLAKESALPLVFALLVARFVFQGTAKPRWSVIGATAIATVLYLIARAGVLDGFAQRSAPWSERVLQVCQNVPLTLRRFVWPWPLSVDYDHALIGRPGALGVVLTLAIAVGGAAWLAAAAARRSVARAIGFAVLFAGIFFVPTSGIVAMKSPTAERFMLLPCAGLAMAVAIAAGAAGATARAISNPAVRRAAAAVFGAAIVALATVTAIRTRDFRSDEALWRAELAVHPRSVQARFGLLHAAIERGDAAEARAIGQSIVTDVAPGDSRRIECLFKLGRLELDLANEERGAALVEQCRSEILARGHVDDLDPVMHLAWVALGNVRRSRFGAADSEAVLREGVALFGRRPRLLEGIGVARDLQGDPGAAQALYQEALAGGEESPSLRYHLALALSHLGRPDEARANVERALTLDPSHVPSRRLRDELPR